MRIIIIGLFVVCLAALTVVIAKMPTQNSDLSDKAKELPFAKATGPSLLGGDFTLTNQDGKEVHDAQFRGKIMLVFFGFTHCPMICPASVATITSVLEQLDEDAEKVVPIFITVDPERDTPSVLKSFLASADDSFVGLTGTQEQINEVLDKYRAYAKKGELMDKKDPDSYMVDHSTHIYLMDQEGRFQQVFTYDVDPSMLAAAVKMFTEGS